jgi:hypothetical protein
LGLDLRPSRDAVWRQRDIVAAGMKPAAKATLGYERKPGWFPLIARALRAGAALLPV